MKTYSLRKKKIQKWIGIAKGQPNQKFAFLMRISITERPEVVKSRLFQCCKENKPFVDFKKITSAKPLQQKEHLLTPEETVKLVTFFS